MPGYISLHRDIQKHWLYEEERVFSRYEAWIDILMRVNHTEGKVTHNGTLETVQRGSTIWSMGDMEKHWKWSNKKVKRFLDCLVADQMLTYKSTTKKTYLTVINYDFYQDKENTKAPPKHQQGTAEAFQKHTNNNENNDNNLKHIVDSDESDFVFDEIETALAQVAGTKETNECDAQFESFWKAYPKKNGKADAQKKWRSYHSKLQIDFNEVMNGLKRYMKFIEYEHSRGFNRAYMDGKTFVNQRQWESEWVIDKSFRLVSDKKTDRELEIRKQEIALNKWIAEGRNPDEFIYRPASND